MNDARKIIVDLATISTVMKNAIEEVSPLMSEVTSRFSVNDTIDEMYSLFEDNDFVDVNFLLMSMRDLSAYLYNVDRASGVILSCSKFLPAEELPESGTILKSWKVSEDGEWIERTDEVGQKYEEENEN